MDNLSVSLVTVQEKEELTAKFVVKLDDQELCSFLIQLLDQKSKQTYCDFVKRKEHQFEFIDPSGRVAFQWRSETTIRITVAYQGVSTVAASMILLPFNILERPLTELADLLE